MRVVFVPDQRGGGLWLLARENALLPSDGQDTEAD